MKIAQVTLESVSPISFSRYHNIPKEKGEKADDHEMRTWRSRCHVDQEGYLFIPPMAIKKAIDNGAAYRNEKIKGQGQKTYAQKFLSGVLVQEGIRLPVKVDQVEGEWFMMDSQGKKGGKGGTRVPRCYPVVRDWSGTVEIHILDDVITEDIFTSVLTDAGMFIGLCRFRPQVGGFYGRFRVTKIKWILNFA